MQTLSIIAEFICWFLPLKTVTAPREYCPAALWLFVAPTRSVPPACGTYRRPPAPSWSSRWSGCSQSAETDFWCTTPSPPPTHISSPREFQPDQLIPLRVQPRVMKMWRDGWMALPVPAACMDAAGMSVWCVFSLQGSGWRCFGNKVSTTTRTLSLCLHKPGNTRVRTAESGI